MVVNFCQNMLTFSDNLSRTRQIGTDHQAPRTLSALTRVYLYQICQKLIYRIALNDKTRCLTPEVNISSYLPVKLQIRYLLPDLLNTYPNYLITFTIQIILDLKNKLMHNTMMLSSWFALRMKNVEMVKVGTWLEFIQNNTGYDTANFQSRTRYG